MPINQRFPVAEVLDAAFAYADGTGRRLSIEYALMPGVNDQPERADLLGRRCCAGTARAREPHPAEPDPGQPLDGQHAGGRAGVRPPPARRPG